MPCCAFPIHDTKVAPSAPITCYIYFTQTHCIVRSHATCLKITKWNQFVLEKHYIVNFYTFLFHSYFCCKHFIPTSVHIVLYSTVQYSTVLLPVLGIHRYSQGYIIIKRYPWWGSQPIRANDSYSNLYKHDKIVPVPVPPQHKISSIHSMEEK